MLVLSRKLTQEIQIGENVTIKVLRLSASQVRIGIDAPADTVVVRKELLDAQAQDESERSVDEARA